MNKRFLAVAGIVAVVAVGVAVAALSGRPPAAEPSAMRGTPTPTLLATASPVASSQAVATATSARPGAYVDYRAGIVEATAGTKVLFFHAAWCSQCRAIERSIRAGTIPAGATIIKVDYDSNQSLRQSYGVTIQTTFVRVDDNGKLIQKYVAYDEPTLAAVVRNLKL